MKRTSVSCRTKEGEEYDSYSKIPNEKECDSATIHWECPKCLAENDRTFDLPLPSSVKMSCICGYTIPVTPSRNNSNRMFGITSLLSSAHSIQEQLDVRKQGKKSTEKAYKKVKKAKNIHFMSLYLVVGSLLFLFISTLFIGMLTIVSPSIKRVLPLFTDTVVGPVYGALFVLLVLGIIGWKYVGRTLAGSAIDPNVSGYYAVEFFEIFEEGYNDKN